jgi:hypothetical protein
VTVPTQTGTPARPDPTPSPRANHPALSRRSTFGEAADADAASSAPGPTQAHASVGLLAFCGIDLLVIGELVDRLEGLEGDLGIGWLNLTVATLFATVIVCTVALIGDSALNAGARRIGHRPGARLLTPLLAAAGGAALCGILVDHLAHPIGLDGWIGLGGALLLLGAAYQHAATHRAR